MATAKRKPVQADMPADQVDLGKCSRDAEHDDCFWMSKEGESNLSVNENSLDTMTDLGWSLVEIAG